MQTANEWMYDWRNEWFISCSLYMCLLYIHFPMMIEIIQKERNNKLCLKLWFIIFACLWWDFVRCLFYIYIWMKNVMHFFTIVILHLSVCVYVHLRAADIIWLRCYEIFSTLPMMIRWGIVERSFAVPVLLIVNKNGYFNIWIGAARRESLVTLGYWEWNRKKEKRKDEWKFQVTGHHLL